MGQLNEARGKNNNMKTWQNYEATNSFAEPKKVFWGMEKLVQLKIVHHKVSAMLYSVQNLKIRAAEG